MHPCYCVSIIPERLRSSFFIAGLYMTLSAWTVRRCEVNSVKQRRAQVDIELTSARAGATTGVNLSLPTLLSCQGWAIGSDPTELVRLHRFKTRSSGLKHFREFVVKELMEGVFALLPIYLATLLLLRAMKTLGKFPTPALHRAPRSLAKMRTWCIWRVAQPRSELLSLRMAGSKYGSVFRASLKTRPARENRVAQAACTDQKMPGRWSLPDAVSRKGEVRVQVVSKGR
jgi:hypothetical protein